MGGEVARLGLLGPVTGRALEACLLDSQRKEEAGGLQGCVQLPSPQNRHTYSFILSTNTCLSGPVCASHCVGGEGVPGGGAE